MKEESELHDDDDNDDDDDEEDGDKVNDRDVKSTGDGESPNGGRPTVTQGGKPITQGIVVGEKGEVKKIRKIRGRMEGQNKKKQRRALPSSVIRKKKAARRIRGSDRSSDDTTASPHIP